jgi:hypothetical protein
MQNDYKRVMFIAPSDSGLKISPETDSLQELHYEVRNLEGVVTPERIFESVLHYRCDIMHFACHSDSTAVYLSNNVPFTDSAILQVARQTCAKIVVLNGCTSARIGQMLVDNDVLVAIVTLCEIPDDVARQTAQTFYSMLARLGDPNAAYKASKPTADGRYLFLSDGGFEKIAGKPVLDKLMILEASSDTNARQIIDLSQAMAELRGAVAHLRTYLAGYVLAATVVLVAVDFIVRLLGK